MYDDVSWWMWQATVREALWFSARLRLGREVDNAAMWSFVNQVLYLVDGVASSPALLAAHRATENT